MIGVIGATGGIGRQVVAKLAGAQSSLRLIVRDESWARSILGPKHQYVVADLSNLKTLEIALEGLQSLFLVSPVGPEMVRLQGGVIETAAISGVKHIVRISSIAVGNPKLDLNFARWHTRLDEQLKACGIPWTILRPSNFMRNLLGLADTIRKTGKLIAPLGNGKICFMDDSDIAAVAATTLTDSVHRGNTYTLTGSEWLDYHEVAVLISTSVGQPVDYESVTTRQAREIWREAGHPDWLVDDLSDMYEYFAGNTVSPVTGHVEAVTGRSPRQLKDFLAEHAFAFQTKG